MIIGQILFFMALEDIYHMEVNDVLQVMFLMAIILTGNITFVRIAIALDMCIIYMLSTRLTTEKIGGADIKILCSLILYGGINLVIIVLFISSIFGILYSLIMNQKKIAFVPFIWIGYLIANI